MNPVRTLTAWTGVLRRRRLLAGGTAVRTSWGHEVRCSRWAFCPVVLHLHLFLPVFLVRLADLGGAARLWLIHTGSRSAEEEVRKASRGRCSLAGVMHSEALPGVNTHLQEKDT